MSNTNRRSRDFKKNIRNTGKEKGSETISILKYRLKPIFQRSRRESNPQLPLRRGLLYPFNYENTSSLSSIA